MGNIHLSSFRLEPQTSWILGLSVIPYPIMNSGNFYNKIGIKNGKYIMITYNIPEHPEESGFWGTIFK